MSLREQYVRDKIDEGFVNDPMQEKALDGLEALTARLLANPRQYSRWTRMRLRYGSDNASLKPVRGLYLWGGVGRGKTYLMDLFFNSLPITHKYRSHFHRFIHGVHAELKVLRGRTDPLKVAAARLARKTRIICFDEFFVSDVADAMILGTLFKELFRRGVTLVATSNIAPDDLYQGGLQRQRFLPAIDQIKTHADILHMDGATDYRLRLLERAEIYHSPLDGDADRNLHEYFTQIAPEPGKEKQTLDIEKRLIQTRFRAPGVVWFNFNEICGGPRGQADYIEIARCYHTVLISNIPLLGASREDQARRFIALVDEFYDHNVKLIVSAALPLDELYQGERLGFEFKRTRSRLEEMQSHDYLARQHLP